jgi:RNA polymerase sigma factor (sigma-70 family)
MQDATDEALMQRFIQGDEEAFTALHQRYAPRVRRFLLRLTGNEATADELTQTTFVSLVVSRGRYDWKAPVRPWLYAIATNAARDHYRRRVNEVLSEEPAKDESVQPTSRDLGLEKMVQKALAELPADQREAIVLHRFEGLSFAEVAQTVGVSVGAVKVRAHRGYERLRVSLKGVWEDFA